MKHLFVILIMMCIGKVYAQLSENWIVSNSSSGGGLELSADFDYGMIGLDNISLPDLVYGGRLDSLEKSIMSLNLEEINSVRGGFTGKASYLSHCDSLFGSDRIAWYAQLGYTQLLAVDFSKDAFDLMFFGNQAFEGSAASLNVNAHRWHYQKLVLGFYGKKKSIYAGLEIYKGSDWMSVSTNNSKFYTANGGSYLDFNLHTEAQFSDSSNLGIAGFNGMGLGWQLGYTFKNEDNQGVLQIGIEDLGVMFWNRKTRHIRKDTSYNFQGFELSELLNGNLNFSNVNDTLNLTSEEGSTLRMLPFLISIRKMPVFEDDINLAVSYGLNYRYRFHARPEMYAGLVYRPSEAALISASIAYGGYYRTHLKFGVNMFLSENVALAISSRAVVNSILNSGHGKSVNLNLRVNL